MTRIKICGLTRPADIEAVNAARADYAGFVFAPSRRRITPRAARALRERLLPGVLAVGVFADEAPEAVLSAAREAALDLIQLHGRESAEAVAHIRARSGLPLIKAFAVADGESPPDTDGCPADYLLFDGPGGGSGRSFNLSRIGRPNRPFFLAGGLHAGNVAEAVGRVHPFAVDVSSGVETGGVKDPEKISAFVRRVRGE